MKIRRFRAVNYRNLTECEIEPSKNINVIFGENAQGKTNLIEGMYLFSGLKSFRGVKDCELKEFTSEKAKIFLDFYSHRREQTAEIELVNRRKSFLNGVKLSSSSELTEQVHIIVFSPDLLSIIKEGPQERRKFLDTAIAEIYPKYQETVKKYKRIIFQRGAVLKDYKNSGNLHEVLDEYDLILAKYGTSIVKTRIKYLDKIAEFLPKIYSDLTKEKEKIEVMYSGCCDGTDENELYEKIRASREKDIATGVTNVGAHHDDILFLINGVDTKKYGSQGQQRSCIIAMKLAEAEILREITGERPVALLDDVMSELDAKRQDYILNHIKDWQVFITCCDVSTVKRLKNGKVFHVENGVVSEIGKDD